MTHYGTNHTEPISEEHENYDEGYRAGYLDGLDFARAEIQKIVNQIISKEFDPTYMTRERNPS